MTIYSTKVSAHYIARRQAAQAGGSPVNFLAGTVIVGDGNGAVPAVSDLVTAGGVLHEVWRGQVVVAVNVDEGNPAQLDIRCVIPAVIGGTEVGPFWVREFVITDETGVVCVYGTTALEKTTSAQGQISDLSWIAAIGESDASVVVLSPPSSNFVTQSDMQSAINSHHPTTEEPIYASDTVSPSGWLQRLLRIRRADPTQIGVERPASATEFAAGVGSTSPWPWPTLAQVTGALAALSTSIGNVANALTVSGEGVAIDGEHKANLAFPGLASAAELNDSDSVALWQGDHHRKSPLSALVAWLLPKAGFGVGVGQMIVTGAHGSFLDQNPADWGYSVGMTASAAQIASGSVPGVTPGGQHPYSGATNTPHSYWFGEIAGTWRLDGWSYDNNSGFVVDFNLYWRRVS